MPTAHPAGLEAMSSAPAAMPRAPAATLRALIPALRFSRSFRVLLPLLALCRHGGDPAEIPHFFTRPIDLPGALRGGQSTTGNAQPAGGGSKPGGGAAKGRPQLDTASRHTGGAARHAPALLLHLPRAEP